MELNLIEQLFRNNQRSILQDWERLLRFKTIGTESAYQQDCIDCAQWLSHRLASHGFNANVVETDNQPFVFAERYVGDDRPVILFYGHYDVQPVDPLTQWISPPFDPQWREGRLYGRGAQDNKGQLFYTLCAMEALIAANKLDLNIKVLIEGEEESGSKSLNHVLGKWEDRLKADVIMVHDTLTVASGAPTLVMGLRGIVNLNVEVHGASHDLHSGLHGGLAPNAAQGAAQLIASLFNQDGGVNIEGFYDGVQPPDDNEKKLACSLPFDRKAYEQQAGTSPEGGIRSAQPFERVGFLPSLDINGFHSGYGGDGMKTIIPSTAQIKITARLVAGQEPEDILNAIVAHLYRHLPPGLRLTITDKGVGGSGLRLDPTCTTVLKSRHALETVCPDQAVAFLWEGASIPIVARLCAISGGTPILTGFGHETDRIHAPNESFSLEQFKKGYLYTAQFLQSF